MAKGFSLCLVVVLALASSSVALKCYICEDCENGSIMSMDCPPTTDTCVKAVHEGKVSKTCAAKAMCETIDMGKQAAAAMNNLQGLLGDSDEGMPSMDDLPEFECCDTDYCNAASIKMMNPALLLLLPLALYFFRC